MTPATYVEKPPAFTACQWDGTDEAREWLQSVYGAAATVVDGQLQIEGAVHPYTLDQGMWVVTNPTLPSAAPLEMDDDTFRLRYEERS